MSVMPLLVGGFTFFGLRKVSSSYEKVTNEVLPNLEAADQIIFTSVGFVSTYAAWLFQETMSLV